MLDDHQEVHLTFDFWFLSFVICHMTFDFWHFIFDIWHSSLDFCHVTFDILEPSVFQKYSTCWFFCWMITWWYDDHHIFTNCIDRKRCHMILPYNAAFDYVANCNLVQSGKCHKLCFCKVLLPPNIALQMMIMIVKMKWTAMAVDRFLCSAEIFWFNRFKRATVHSIQLQYTVYTVQCIAVLRCCCFGGWWIAVLLWFSALQWLVSSVLIHCSGWSLVFWCLVIWCILQWCTNCTAKTLGCQTLHWCHTRCYKVPGYQINSNIMLLELLPFFNFFAEALELHPGVSENNVIWADNLLAANNSSRSF